MMRITKYVMVSNIACLPNIIRAQLKWEEVYGFVVSHVCVG